MTQYPYVGINTSTGIVIFKMTVTQTLTVKVSFSALKVPSGATALTTPRTEKGIMDGEGTYNKTSWFKVTEEVALPSVPFASM